MTPIKASATEKKTITCYQSNPSTFRDLKYLKKGAGNAYIEIKT